MALKGSGDGDEVLKLRFEPDLNSARAAVTAMAAAMEGELRGVLRKQAEIYAAGSKANAAEAAAFTKAMNRASFDELKSFTQKIVAQETERISKSQSLSKKARQDEVAGASETTRRIAQLSKKLGDEEAADARKTVNTIQGERRRGQEATKASYFELLQAQRRLSAAQSAESKRQASDEVRDADRKVQSVTASFKRMEAEHRKATQGISVNWRRTMEDLENITTVATGAWGVIMGGASRFKALGDSIATTTNIYGSLKGSIDSMREATGGQIADIDLITTKNRAVQKELTLTDEQFSLVAASADVFADALGTNTKDALDGLIDGLATGRLKSMAVAGVIVDETKALAVYADAHDKAADTLSEHEKMVAKIEASLRAMDKKLIESGGGIETFADKWEMATAKVTNIGDEIKLSVGGAISYVVDLLFTDVPNAITKFILYLDVIDAKAQDILNGLNPFAKNSNMAAAAQDVLNAHKKNVADMAKVDAEAADKRVKDAIDRQRRDTNPTMADLAMFGGKGSAYDASGAVDRDRTPGRARGGRGAGTGSEFSGIDRLLFFAEQADANRKLTDDIENRRSKELADLLDDAAKRGAVNEGGAEAFIASKSAPTYAGALYTAEEEAGIGRGVTTREDQQKLREQMATIGREVKTIEGVTTQEGPGLIEKMMFGPNGSPEELYNAMTEAEQITFDATQKMKAQFDEAGQGMANAFGASAAAALASEKSFGAAFKSITRGVLMNLAATSLAEGAKEIAYGFRDSAAAATFAATGNFPQASAMGAAAASHFVAAGKFGLIGVAAGVGAGMLNSSGGSAGGASAGGGATASRTPPSSDSSRSERRGPENITLNIYSPLSTDPSAVGAAMDEAFHRYRQLTGREIGARR